MAKKQRRQKRKPRPTKKAPPPAPTQAPSPDDFVFGSFFQGHPMQIDPAKDGRLAEMVLEAETVAAMQTAGVRPAIIHAYRKTGRIVTAYNMGLLTPEELAEWNEAIAEYRRGEKGPTR